MAAWSRNCWGELSAPRCSPPRPQVSRRGEHFLDRNAQVGLTRRGINPIVTSLLGQYRTPKSSGRGEEARLLTSRRAFLFPPETLPWLLDWKPHKLLFSG